jgi:hypothetical protein
MTLASIKLLKLQNFILTYPNFLISVSVTPKNFFFLERFATKYEMGHYYIFENSKIQRVINFNFCKNNISFSVKFWPSRLKFHKSYDGVKINQFILFNPWNHRADISAQAYLKPSKKGKKMSQNCFFRMHYKKFCGDSETNTQFFFGYFVRILRRVDFLKFFVEVLLPEKLFRNKTSNTNVR